MGAPALSQALQDTAIQLIKWAESDENNGPWRHETWRTYVHISSALNILAAKVEAAFAVPAAREELDALIAADIAAGMSLRKCAEKYGVGVGRVRGAIARVERREVPVHD